MRLCAVLIALVLLTSCGSPADDVAADASSTTSTVPATTTIPTTETTVSTTETAAPATTTTSTEPAVATTETAAPAATTTTTEPAASTTTTEPAASTTTTEPAEPTETTSEADASGDSEIESLVDELAAYVETERGLEFQRRPQIELLDNDEFARAWVTLISEDAAENATDFQHFTTIYRTMGIISPTDTLEDIWTRFGDAGVLGYYETESEQIVLRAGEINTLTKTTLVHELVHALEDQAFNLDRPSYSEREDEIGWAFSSVIEGSARVIENRYRSTLTQAEVDEERSAIANLPRSVSLSEFTPSFLELQFGRYTYGERFADALWAQGQQAIDQALLNPPSASELILDPDSFLAGVQADAPVAAPPADGPVFEEGVWGEAAWIALLSDVLPVAESRQIADGWGGDWYVAWQNAGSTCVRIDVAADDATELDQYETGLRQWVDAQNGRELHEPAPGVLRVTACR